MSLGFGVMIGMLTGNEETVAALRASVGKIIKDLLLENDDALHLTFDDDSKIRIFDDGQSCCESRYMQTDDDLQSYIGGVFLSIEVKDGPSVECEYGEHETQFLEITTSKGCFTMVTHNEHNGYYGGFNICVREEEVTGGNGKSI